jgi:hypothetical protein
VKLTHALSALPFLGILGGSADVPSGRFRRDVPAAERAMVER